MGVSVSKSDYPGSEDSGGVYIKDDHPPTDIDEHVSRLVIFNTIYNIICITGYTTTLRYNDKILTISRQKCDFKEIYVMLYSCSCIV